MTHNEGVDVRQIDLQEVIVMEQHFPCSTKVEQDLSGFIVSLRFQVGGEAPLTLKHAIALRTAYGSCPFNLDIANMLASRKNIVKRVDDNTNRKAIDDRRCA